MIGRKSFFFILSNFLSQGLAFVALFFITQFLGSESYGTIAWALALVATINTIADLGFGNAHIKRISEGKDVDDCISTYILIQILLISIMVSLVSAILILWEIIYQTPLSSSTLKVIVIFVLYYIFSDISAIAVNTYNAKMETAKSQLLTLVGPLIRVPFIILISIQQRGVVELAIAYLVGSIAVAIVSSYLIKGSFKWQKPTLIHSYSSFALSIAPITITNALSINLDKIILGIFFTSTAVAYYSSSQTLMSILSVIGFAITTLLFPSFSRSFYNGDIVGVERKTIMAERYILLLCIPIVTFIFVFSEEIVSILLGSDFAPASSTLKLLSISTVLVIMNQAYYAQLLAASRSDLYTKLSFLNLAINSGLLIILVPTSVFGIQMFGLSHIGAALASLLSTVMVSILLRTVAYGISGTKINLKLVLHLIVAILVAIFLTAISILVPVDGIVMLIVVAAVSITLHYLILFLIKEMTISDIRYFIDVLNVRKLFHYIYSEINN